MQNNKDIEYMNEALEQAKKAFDIDEVPIGAIIVKNDEIIAKAFNRRNTDKNTLAHAEILAINEASKVVGDWRLDDCTMYITLEPCPMCAGAIVQARIPRVVLAANNKKAGCAGSIINLLEEERFNHQVHVTREVLEEKSSKLLKDFFRELREKNK
ncbi:tRNA adenosine(34) deaminase TadA [Vallitalea guaymasensis]|nr:tRNA adenosine(34) deaminase TadA [Vallitalea guaymasensis]